MTQFLPMVAKGLSTRRRGKTLVGPVDLRLEGQGATMVIGPNGSGKTSLLSLLHGTSRIAQGSLQWACPTEEAQHHQAFVFQRPVMLRRSVLDNIAYPLVIRGVTRKDARDRAGEWADRVGLVRILERPATVLSGGEQQKLALARALITDPKVLFLDEPCAALDGRATREIEEILQAAKTSGTRLVMATHDMGQARRLGDEVWFLLGGKLHESGTAQAFFDDPQTDQARAFLKGDIVE